MRKIAVIVGSLAMLAGAIAANRPAMAATPTPEDRVAELERRLDASAKLIEELNARVRSLEARVPSQGAATTAAAAPSNAPSPTPDAAPQSDEADRLATVEREVSEIAAGASSRNASGLPVHGFADVGAGSRTATDPDRKGFVVGSLDFYLTPELGDRVRSLFELNFEVDEEGEIATDLERAQIGYQVADSATVWLGRFHTPYGYYNTAFHHGQQISMALRRPRFIQFEDEGGVMPAHTVGLWMTGGHRFSSGRWTYDAFMGNAQRIEDGTLNMAQAGLSSAEMTFGGNLGYLPGGSLDGLKVGASFMAANVEDDAVVPNRTRVLNFGLYGVYDTDQWENIIEFYHWDNDDRSGATGSHTSDAGFVQVAYRMNRFSPYARYERASLDQADAYFAAQATGGSYYRSAIGIRFDLDLSAAIKLELARTVNTDRTGDEFSEALMQYAIRF